MFCLQSTPVVKKKKPASELSNSNAIFSTKKRDFARNFNISAEEETETTSKRFKSVKHSAQVCTSDESTGLHEEWWCTPWFN